MRTTRGIFKLNKGSDPTFRSSKGRQSMVLFKPEGEKEMSVNGMILGKGHYYSLDTYKTKLNNNVLVVGASGTGKTRSIVTPNILQVTGSYIVSDPKGNLYSKYKGYLMSKGYIVKKLDFTDPTASVHYNFFSYIRNTQDIVKIAHMLIYGGKAGGYKQDPFWDESSQLLLQAIISMLIEDKLYNNQNLQGILESLSLCDATGDLEDVTTPLDLVMEKLVEKDPNSYAGKIYKMVRVSASRTLRSILISVFAKLGIFDTPDLNEMMAKDDIDIPSIGKNKTALFVVVSDTDRSMDVIADIFFTQAMNELCYYADKSCANNRLPVPVRFFLDDFATNCHIAEFPRMIASIRSREISTMLMIQAESQLERGYGEEAKTIIGNCDTYVYLGGNDVETAKAVSERCNLPVQKILNMPVGTNWIFRRGQSPVNGENYDLETLLRQKKLIKESTGLERAS